MFGIGAAIIGAVGTAIGAIASCAAGVVKGLAVIGMAVEGIKAIGGVFMGIAKALGIIEDENMDVEELGDKAIQSDYKPENFESYEKYVDAVKQFQTDPERSAQISEEDKVKKGTEVVAGISIEKYGSDVDFKEFSKLLSNSNFITKDSPEKFMKLVEALPDNPAAFDSAVKFLNDSPMSKSRMEAGMELLKNNEKALSPGLSDTDAAKNVFAMQK